eukprot:1608661-Pyramimonas_sp.AAC.1
MGGEGSHAQAMALQCVLGPTMQTHYATLRGAVQTVLAKCPSSPFFVHLIAPPSSDRRSVSRGVPW